MANDSTKPLMKREKKARQGQGMKTCFHTPCDFHVSHSHPLRLSCFPLTPSARQESDRQKEAAEKEKKDEDLKRR